MFESAEIGHKIDREEYKKRLPALREALLDAQYDMLQSRKFPVIVLIGGVNGGGKGETANILNEWFDPRHINTFAFGPATSEESQRPPMWRFWQSLPPQGEIGILFGSWYNDPITDKSHGKIKKNALDKAIEDIVRLERMLTDEGTLLIKLWFHLSKDQQKTRIKSLQKDPATRWRITDQDMAELKLYDKIKNVSGHVIRETSTAFAPWVIVEGYDANYRNLTAGQVILEAIRNRLDNKPRPPSALAAPFMPPLDQLRIVDTLNLDQSLGKEEYSLQLEKTQGKLNQLTRHPAFRKISVVIVFEGVDAAGKGGSIRRITQALDARSYNVVPIAAPTEEERQHPYLWRFWRHLPRRGRITIFDRSWYGRVLVERVEGLCADADWQRAYAEINDFEEQIADHKTLVVKFWLQISPEEQLARFEAREKTSFKRFKITEEDWRNRSKWDAYQDAVCDMIDRTSTGQSPWTLIEANDKYFARIKILKTLCTRLEAALEDQEKAEGNKK
ncbi:polyphosphate:AMP phosphotransferase [Methylovorus glucosotrophus]|uniref:Polyphosphate kinase-2-related domain-containing protein n=1 Tax=Methylovorus glucosotrophus (strain SIP3-4) TaxID=582744 RepID=C6XCW9_METGS|nr:polyphosphate:AMP phosphotransferase [Methylovorus glucosotrophus]ACT50394.1 protein of unknown function DUF344 [Methylovorus glucosotrophus SIP3-4]